MCEICYSRERVKRLSFTFCFPISSLFLHLNPSNTILSFSYKRLSDHVSLLLFTILLISPPTSSSSKFNCGVWTQPLIGCTLPRPFKWSHGQSLLVWFWPSKPPLSRKQLLLSIFLQTPTNIKSHAIRPIQFILLLSSLARQSTITSPFPHPTSTPLSLPHLLLRQVSINPTLPLSR